MDAKAERKENGNDESGKRELGKDEESRIKNKEESGKVKRKKG